MGHLRDYQLGAIARARATIERGCSAPLIVSPTGSGKTTIGAEVARLHVEMGGKVLWLAHRAELVEQAEDRLRAFGALATVTTVQALLAATKRRSFVPPPASLVVFDEAHHYVADEWGTLAGSFGEVVRVGLTATPERGDGRGLGAMFDALVVAATIRDLTALGHLAPLEVVGPSRRLDPGELAMAPVDAYAKFCPGERAVVFARSIEEAHEHRDAFEDRGIDAEVVCGTSATHDRFGALDRHQRGECPVLINAFLLTEGWDSPATSACILARGCRLG